MSDLDELRRRADGGDLDAGFALGARLLVGDKAPFAPEEAAAILAGAAEAGSPQALRLSATLAAAGIGRPQDWAEALRFLAAAAEAGEAHCQAQLRLLAACPDGLGEAAPPPEGDWAAHAAAIDTAAWTAAQDRRAACETPRIREIDRFLSPAVCRWITDRARPGLTRATMYNPNAKQDQPHPGRTNSLVVVDVFRADVVLALVRARMSATVKIPLPCFEPTQILHYAVGEMIAGHYDFLEKREMTRAGTGEPYDGQRIATFLVYLNDAYEGGETLFPKVGYRYRGHQGSALFFANVDEAGQPEKLSLHAGAPPTSGEKWTLSQWIHNQPFTGVS
jgi:prolyl 4-hydroxylase